VKSCTERDTMVQARQSDANGEEREGEDGSSQALSSGEQGRCAGVRRWGKKVLGSYSSENGRGAHGGGPMLVPAVMGCWHGGAGERVADRWAQLPPIIIQIFFK
jgi:hypothetical protein